MKKTFFCCLSMRLIIITVLLLAGSLQSAKAQDRTNRERNLRILFIDHEPSMPVKDVIAYIRRQRAMARENNNSLIIYMPNNQEPFISLTNVQDPYNNGDDTQEAFDAICEAMNLPSHNKEPWYDRNKLVQMFSDYNILDKNGDLLYATVRMEFYLTTEFWKLGYNESIIAPLFFAIDGDSLLKKEFNFDVYVTNVDKLEYDPKAPFGRKNLGGINQIISIYDYDF